MTNVRLVKSIVINVQLLLIIVQIVNLTRM